MMVLEFGLAIGGCVGRGAVAGVRGAVRQSYNRPSSSIKRSSNLMPRLVSVVVVMGQQQPGLRWKLPVEGGGEASESDLR